jgi:hypothetical protein
VPVHEPAICPLPAEAEFDTVAVGVGSAGVVGSVVGVAAAFVGVAAALGEDDGLTATGPQAITNKHRENSKAGRS